LSLPVMLLLTPMTLGFNYMQVTHLAPWQHGDTLVEPVATLGGFCTLLGVSHWRSRYKWRHQRTLPWRPPGRPIRNCHVACLTLLEINSWTV